MNNDQPEQQTASKVNRQLYEHSALAELFAASGPTEPGERFFNQKDPNLAILHEKPHHRLLILLKLRGLSNKEISEQSGFTQPWLSQLFRQPWAVAEMAQISAEAGTESIRGLLQSEAVPSILKLVELRDGLDTPAAVAKASCDSLLDRYLGKPAQHVDVIEHHAGVDTESIAELDNEIARLREEEKTLVGHN